jgi:hypothetical protein
MQAIRRNLASSAEQAPFPVEPGEATKRLDREGGPYPSTLRTRSDGVPNENDSTQQGVPEASLYTTGTHPRMLDSRANWQTQGF